MDISGRFSILVWSQNASEKLVYEGWDSVWTVSETDSKEHPLKQLTIRSGTLDY